MTDPVAALAAPSYEESLAFDGLEEGYRWRLAYAAENAEAGRLIATLDHLRSELGRMVCEPGDPAALLAKRAVFLQLQARSTALRAMLDRTYREWMAPFDERYQAYHGRHSLSEVCR